MQFTASASITPDQLKNIGHQGQIPPLQNTPTLRSIPIPIDLTVTPRQYRKCLHPTSTTPSRFSETYLLNVNVVIVVDGPVATASATATGCGRSSHCPPDACRLLETVVFVVVVFAVSFSHSSSCLCSSDCRAKSAASCQGQQTTRNAPNPDDNDCNFSSSSSRNRRH